MRKTLLLSSLLLLAVIGKMAMTPPVLPSLPGRPGAISAPSVLAEGSYVAAEASDGSFVSSALPHHQISISSVTRSLIEHAGNYALLPVLAAHNPKLSDASANAAANAVTALMNGGDLKLYNGTQAATADTAIGAQTLCATLTFANPAFGSAVAGVATANTITADSSADNDCSPVTWFRILKSDHSTKVMDGAVGTSGSDLNMVVTTVTTGQAVGASSFVYTQSH